MIPFSWQKHENRYFIRNPYTQLRFLNLQVDMLTVWLHEIIMFSASEEKIHSNLESSR